MLPMYAAFKNQADKAPQSMRATNLDMTRCLHLPAFQYSPS